MHRVTGLGIRPGRRRFSRQGPDPDLLATLYGSTSGTLLGHGLGLVLVVALYARLAPEPLLLWVGVFSAVWGLRIAVARRYARAEVSSSGDHRQWERAWNTTSLLCGGAWALAIALLYPYGGTLHKTALILVIYSSCVGAPSTRFRVFAGHALMCFVPMVLHVAMDDLPHNLPMAALITGGFVVTLAIGRQYRRAFGELLSLKVHTEQLAEQLAAQKQAADEARAAAEDAGRAQLRFFAAANHDLRQPLHALALLTHSLRERSREPATRDVIEEISASVDTLSELFNELLDLGRLDAKGVQVHRRPFAVGELFVRLRLHFGPQAFDRGLALRFRGAHHWADADPILVERVLRNLLSNALRYTEDGTVLVGCRRRGDRLQLQVWDSGPGIAPEHQQRIFEEFFQVPHPETPPWPAKGPGRTDGVHRHESRRARGHGLGLAIVRRLTRLMGTPLTLRSTPGRGSVFTLELPAAGPDPDTSSLGDSAQGLGQSALTLAGRRLLVVEDDDGVRSALTGLLETWEAEVLAFADLDQLEHWLRQGSPAPLDLMIVDHNLPGGQSGLQAIERVRRHVSATLPAILITGSAQALAPLARSSGEQVLLKPVSALKLRTLIRHKLAAPAAPHPVDTGRP